MKLQQQRNILNTIFHSPELTKTERSPSIYESMAKFKKPILTRSNAVGSDYEELIPSSPEEEEGVAFVQSESPISKNDQENTEQM